MANRFVLNTISYHGSGAIKEIPGELQRRGYKKIFVCSDPDLVKFGVTAKVTDELDAAGIAWSLYSEIKPNPTIQNVKDGVEAFKAAEADAIVTIGGGSSMDTAKAIGIIINNPEFADVRSLEGVAPTKNHAVFTIAVPTTAGTAAEVTINYVITDPEKVRKFVCVDTNDAPEVAVVDPDMMASMPAGLTASTGMDALTHCMEAYVSTCASMFTDANALHGIREIVEWLPKSYAGDHEARQHMHEAQCIAGIAFSSGLLGIVHSMAHKTGVAFENGHIIHGAANAMYLGKVIQWNSKDPRAAERYAYVAKEILHLPGETNEELIAALVQKIRDLNDQLNIPQSIKDYANGGVKVDAENPQMVSEEEFLAKLPEIAANAEQDACTPENPRETKAADFEKILKACYYDTDIDF